MTSPLNKLSKQGVSGDPATTSQYSEYEMREGRGSLHQNPKGRQDFKKQQRHVRRAKECRRHFKPLLIGGCQLDATKIIARI